MILLFSGGLDSYIGWHYLGRPRTLYVDIGHRYSQIEREVIKELIVTTHIDERLRLGDWEDEDAHIPLRNAFFIMIASYYDPHIAIVCQKGEQDLPDRSPYFFGYMNSLLNHNWGSRNTKTTVTNPFEDMTKVQMVKWYLDKGLPKEELYKTWSCYKPRDPEHYGAFANDLPCGHCSACFRRWVAFVNNDMFDEEYRANILNWEGIVGYLKRMNDGEYDLQRVEETKNALIKVGFESELL